MPKLNPCHPTPLPTLVGESNPYGNDPYYALYPVPEGCAGERLCCDVFQMWRRDYLRVFERLNLCDGPFDALRAALRAEELKARGGRFVLLGGKVCAAFGVPFRPFCQRLLAGGWKALVMPHPSGRNRMWEQPGARERGRAAVVEFLPDVAPLIGRAAILGEVEA